MAYCKHCGSPISDIARACPNCGAPQQMTAGYTGVDSGNIGWGVLGFFFPIVGLILFLIWKDTKPRSAKKAGIGALIGFILNIIFTILYVAFVIGLGLIGMIVSSY